MGVDHRRLQRGVPEILGDQPQTYALFEQMGGVAMPQRVHGGFDGQTAGRSRQPEGVLHHRHAQVRVRPLGGIGGRAPFPPARGRAGKHESRVPVAFPPVPQFLQHRRGQGHEPILAALAAAHVQAGMFGVGFAQIAQFNPDRFADAQAGVIDQSEQGAITRELHRLEQCGDLFAGEHQRQGLGRGDAEFAKHRPAFDVQTVLKEGAQGALGHLHGGGPKLPDLTQFEVIGADLILGERGWVALVMIAEPANVTDVFFLGRPAKIFELDKRGELCE